MRMLLLSVLFLSQGIPIRPMQGGTVTGVLRDSQGKPLPGVRVAAVTRGDTVESVSAGAAMAGLAETDAQGRFTLEDIPPGRYSIAAGRLDRQTYFPGTATLEDARVLTITPGTITSDVDFVLDASSFGRAEPSGLLSIRSLDATIPVTVASDDGGALPVLAYGKAVTIRLESAASIGPDSPITTGSLAVTVPGDYRVVVQNLPEGFEIKSITYGNADVTRGTFRLDPQNFPSLPNSAASTTTTLPTTSSLSSVLYSLTGAQFVLANTTTGVTLVLGGISPVPAASPPSAVSITLASSRRGSTAGVRIAGSGATGPVYLSGRPGVTFSDETYEFRGVPPGLHLIAMNGREKMGALVVVGKDDLDGIQLKEMFVIPVDFRTPKDPMPAGSYAPGTVLYMARIRGVVRNEKTGDPVPFGTVEIRANGQARRIRVDADGRFESMQLGPGTYQLRLEAFAHSTRTVEVTVIDQDIDLEFTTLAL